MDDKLIVLKKGVEIQHKAKLYKGFGKKPAIPESVVKDLLAIKNGIAVDDKKISGLLKAWKEKYEYVEPKESDVDQNASSEGDAIGA